MRGTISTLNFRKLCWKSENWSRLENLKRKDRNFRIQSSSRPFTFSVVNSTGVYSRNLASGNLL